MRRWVCSRCGAGVLAPERPRRDDVRRYCLACSEDTGRLVERSCPALERQRATTTERRREREARRRAKERERWTVSDVRVDVEFRRLCRAANHRPPRLTLHRARSPYSRATSGHCKTWSGHIHLTIREDVAGPAAVRTLLAHEVAHLRHPHHRRPFWRHLVALVADVYGVEAAVDYGWPGWRIDNAIEEALEALDETGG